MMNRPWLSEASDLVSSNSPLKRSGQTTFLENKLFTKVLLKLKIVEIAYVDIMLW